MKTKNILSILILSAIFLNACSKADDDNGQPTEPETPIVGNPVETNRPNTNYQPAFTGQTRINRVQTATAFHANVIATSLSQPWGITSLPDGRLLVTEKAGRLRIVTTAGAVGSPITGIPPLIASGQGGLLGVCIDPQFATNRMVYWVFSEPVSGGGLTAVAKGRLSNNESTIEAPTVIYRSNTAFSGTSHYGGRILFDQTGNLLVSMGEGSSTATRPLAQSVTASIGKVLRITTDGQPAPGNPGFTGTGALRELYTVGHRNPQGLAIHPITGDVWLSEHGPRGGDEINRLQPGANFGWPVITYGIEYGGQAIGAGITQQSGMQQPAYYWDPVVSPSGMTFYRGNRIPEWQSNLFVGALSGQHIARLVIENNIVTGEERLLASESQRFRDVTQGTDGALYAVTDGGRLYRIDRE